MPRIIQPWGDSESDDGELVEEHGAVGDACEGDGTEAGEPSELNGLLKLSRSALSGAIFQGVHQHSSRG